MKSNLETALLAQIKLSGLPNPITEFKAVEGRKFRWDIAFPEQMLLVEIQGGTWIGGFGHNSGKGIARDCEKLNLATVAGYRCLSVTSDQIRSGKAIMWIRQAIEGRP
jgi:hypothetical protein